MQRPDVIALFARQFWVAEIGQLTALGVSPSTITRTRRRNAVVGVLPGVVRVAHAPETFHSRAMALQLHAGPHSFLSGPTAGHLYGLRQMPRRIIEITLHAQFGTTTPPWGRLVRTNWCQPRIDVATRDDGLRVARPLRMLFGLAAQFNDHRFERAAEDVWHLGLVAPAEAAEYLQAIRKSGKTGVARFERWLEKTAARTRPSQSGFELDVLDALLAAGLPEPARQHALTLPSGEVIHLDLAWPSVRLAVEPGHSWWHGGDLAQRADQARQRACDAVGWRVLPYDESARADLAAVGREVRQVYDERKRSLRSPRWIDGHI